MERKGSLEDRQVLEDRCVSLMAEVRYLDEKIAYLEDRLEWWKVRSRELLDKLKEEYEK